MRFFVEYRIKNPKLFWTQWEKAQGSIPKNCHFIQLFSSKDAEVCIGVWEGPNDKILKVFTKEFFSGCCMWNCHEIDEYHVEGESIRNVG